MFAFTQPFVYWTGVAVNPSGGDDKDISVYADPGGAGTPLASSTGTVGTDFVVGDFNHNADRNLLLAGLLRIHLRQLRDRVGQRRGRRSTSAPT